MHVLYNKAEKLKKRYLQRCLEKEAHVRVMEWVARVLELNKYLMESLRVNGVAESQMQK